MANNLSYQQARTIRKTKFTDLFVDQLAQKDTSVLGAVGKTLSLRTSARFKGYKEKFDPLNIARFLTFGSKLGPALYGKMMGRSQKDIDYFTNRTRAIKGGNNTADRIGPSKNDGMLGINEQLAKIYQFLKSSREDDTRQTELENNAEEELNVERERRHRELLETLRKLVGNLGGTTVTATATQDNSFLNSLWTKLKGLADVVESLKDAVVEIVKKLGIPLLSGLARLGRFGWLAATNPITGFVIAGTTLGTGVYGILNSYSDEQLKQVAESGDTGAEMAAVILAGRDKTDADRVLQDERNERIQQLLKEYKASFPLRSYGAPEQHRKFLEEKGLRRADLDQLFPDVEAGPEIVNPRQMKGKLELQTTPTPPPAAPPEPVMDQTPESGKLNVVTKENVSLNLPTNTTNKALDDATVNKVINTPQRTGKKIPMPAVRNLEASFQRMIINSTRVV